MVRGNNENYLLRFDFGQSPRLVAYQLTNGHLFAGSINTWMNTLLRIIRALPEQRVITPPGKDPIRVVHGSPRDPNEHLYPGYEGYALETALEQTSNRYWYAAIRTSPGRKEKMDAWCSIPEQ